MAASNPIDFATLGIVLQFVKDAVLLRGPHGIGKSAVPAAVAKKTGMRLLDVRLSLFTEGDLVGVPDHERIKSTGVTSFAPPDWLHTACTKPGASESLGAAQPSTCKSSSLALSQSACAIKTLTPAT